MPDSRFQSRFWKVYGIAFEWHHASGHLTLYCGAVDRSLGMDQSRPGQAHAQKILLHQLRKVWPQCDGPFCDASFKSSYEGLQHICFHRGSHIVVKSSPPVMFFFFSPALGGPWVRVIAVRPQYLGPLVPDSRFQSGFWKLCGIAFEWHHASGHLTLWDWAVARSLQMDRFRPGPALQKWPNFTSLDRCDPNVMDHFAMHHFVALLMIFEVKELWQVYHIGVKSCAPSTKPHFGQKWRFSWCPPKSKFGPNLDSHGVPMVSGAFRDLCWVIRSKFSNLIIRWSA